MPESDRPVCSCHGEPKARNGVKDGKPQWVCRHASRARCRDQYDAAREAVCRARRDRYDADPIHRISKCLQNSAHKRALTTERMRQRLEGLRNG